jgi:hypothetical protein
VGRAGGAGDGDVESGVLAVEAVGVAEKAVDGFLAEGFEDGVLLD